MIRVLGLVVAIALGDSVNPSTIVPALYIASGNRPRRRTLGFTLAVFIVHFVAGVLLVIGPGRLLLSLVNGLDPTIQDALEIAAGVALIAGAWVVWRRRHELAEKELPKPPRGKSSLVLGASIIAVELPTAFPYFAAIAAILGASGHLTSHLAMLWLYNVCFVLPLIAIIVWLLVAGDRSKRKLAHGREVLQRRWPTVLAALLIIAGMFVLIAGGAGLATSSKKHARKSAAQSGLALPGVSVAKRSHPRWRVRSHSPVYMASIPSPRPAPDGPV